jgi:hypothetical protein
LATASGANAPTRRPRPGTARRALATRRGSRRVNDPAVRMRSPRSPARCCTGRRRSSAGSRRSTSACSCRSFRRRRSARSRGPAMSGARALRGGPGKLADADYQAACAPPPGTSASSTTGCYGEPGCPMSRWSPVVDRRGRAPQVCVARVLLVGRPRLVGGTRQIGLLRRRLRARIATQRWPSPTARGRRSSSTTVRSGPEWTASRDGRDGQYAMTSRP